MKTRVFLLCTAVLLISVGGSAQKTDLSRIKTRTVTLDSRFKGHPQKVAGNVVIEGSGASLATDGKSIFSFESGKRGDVGVRRGVIVPAPSPFDEETGVQRDPLDFTNPRNVGEVRNLPNGTAPDVRINRFPGRAVISLPSATPRRRYDIWYGSVYIDGDDNWLAIFPSKGRLGMIKDMGEMRWSDVDHVPLLILNPHPAPLGFKMIRGKTTFTPEGSTIKPTLGHLYVLHIRDHKKDRYAIFRVEALDPKGECTISWKRVPTPKQ